jgi:hypothetical protein
MKQIDQVFGANGGPPRKYPKHLHLRYDGSASTIFGGRPFGCRNQQRAGALTART